MPESQPVVHQTIAPQQDTADPSQSQQVADHSIRMRVNEAVIAILRSHTGRGATRARSMIDSRSVVVILEDCLTKGEGVLLEHDMGQSVLDLRHSFQEAMRDDMIPAVEEIVGRDVTTFLSANSVDPDVMVEIFMLGDPSSDTAGGA
ncbi:Na-translocating system protein MpsC family protein [Patulibacter sp.]|uniref:Na-translocating system protein MpsC family protein n=1 Tax=Patulibacter sp. TaxID=1912859 RepID=UPI0027179AE0|nr:Na-translocating system protein MpsC family protein [Patulibacter sp.]MDO9406975.1 Na-translocating system protein MpsC family protein [Patulibacter sp.]